MSKLPQVKPKVVIKVLQKIDFQIKKQSGSHVDLRHPDGRRTTVPMHNKPLGKGLLNAILNQTKLTVEQLKDLL